MKTMSVVSPDIIRNHQANNSPSKQSHAFPKSKRFPEPNPECKVAFYSNDSHLSNRKTSFGYGKKSDFTKDLTASPGSTKYTHKSSFDAGKNKGIMFGLEREKLPDNSYLIPQLSKFPGPGQYENQVKTRMSQSYTMRAQTIDFIQQKMSYKQSPGPGAYQHLELQPKTGRFKVSKFSDVKLCKINPNTPRFQNIKQSPGPFTYREGDSLAKDAKYRLSHHKGNGTRAFSQTARSTFTDMIKSKEKWFPGPGFYEKPTEFGVYGDTRYYKTLGSFKSTISTK